MPYHPGYDVKYYSHCLLHKQEFNAIRKEEIMHGSQHVCDCCLSGLDYPSFIEVILNVANRVTYRAGIPACIYIIQFCTSPCLIAESTSDFIFNCQTISDIIIL